MSIKDMNNKIVVNLKQNWEMYFIAIIVISVFIVGFYSFFLKPQICDIITFQNSHLKKAIEKDTHIINISRQQAKDIKKLSIKSKTGFENLYDLKHFTNLEELEVSGCSLESLDGIENLEKLTTLKCNSNNIEDISAVYGLNVKSIDLSNNNISDISNIASHLKQLEILNINNCEITGEVYLGRSDSLKQVDISSNFVSQLSGEVPNLQILNCSDNCIEDINHLIRFSQLKELRLSDNKVNSINGIGKLENLELLAIENTEVKDINKLKNIKKLNSIYIDAEIDRSQLDFMVDNFKTGDVATKKYMLKHRYKFLD